MFSLRLLLLHSTKLSKSLTFSSDYHQTLSLLDKIIHSFHQSIKRAEHCYRVSIIQQQKVAIKPSTQGKGTHTSTTNKVIDLGSNDAGNCNMASTGGPTKASSTSQTVQTQKFTKKKRPTVAKVMVKLNTVRGGWSSKNRKALLACQYFRDHQLIVP